MIPSVLGFCDGLDAFCFLDFSALGLRTSRFDLFWPLAIVCSFTLDVRSMGYAVSLVQMPGGGTRWRIVAVSQDYEVVDFCELICDRSRRLNAASYR